MRNPQPESPVLSIGERLPGGDAGAPLTQLFESLRPDLLRFAHWLARDRAIAEDIVQESLLRAWRSREALKDPSAARPWLLTIVRREHARLYERKRLELVPLDEVVETHAGEASAEAEDDLFALRHAIMKLPLEYREPLVLQVLGGFSTEEIARELALSSTAVLTRLFRARNKLRVICGLPSAPDAAAAGTAVNCDTGAAAHRRRTRQRLRGARRAPAGLRGVRDLPRGDAHARCQHPARAAAARRSWRRRARRAARRCAPGGSGRSRRACCWPAPPRSACGCCGRPTRWRTSSWRTCRRSRTAGSRPQQVTTEGIDEALRSAGVQLDVTSDKITYAHSCWFRGHYVPHLVVQTSQGPATVLILHHEKVPAGRRSSFSEAGMSGVIIPAQTGSIALLTRGGDVNLLAQEMQHDMHWLPDAR